MKNYFLSFQIYLTKKFIQLAISSILILQGCSFPKNINPDIYLETAHISLDKDANNTSATSVDIIVVYNMDLFNSLMKMDASEYFVNIRQLQKDYPEMSDISHWELIPGQKIEDLNIESRFLGPVGAFAFASYSSPGSHRIRIGSSSEIHLLLKKNDFCIVEQGCLSLDEIQFRPPLSAKNKNNNLEN